jgi:DNA-binding MarR family transcriptional regulator
VEPADVDESLSDTFMGVARALRHRSSRVLAPWNITPSQSRALGVLMHHGPMRLSDLAEHLRIAPRSATEVVDDLETRGLVERRADPHDRRATLAALTDNGTATGYAIRQARQAETDRVFGSLGEPDRAALARILRDLRAAIDG